jgi:hypothetical protein
MVCERSSLLLHLNRHIDKGVTCVYDGRVSVASEDLMLLTVTYQIVTNVFLGSEILQSTRRVNMPMTNPHLLRCPDRPISSLLPLCLRVFRHILWRHGLALGRLSQRNVMRALALG